MSETGTKSNIDPPFQLIKSKIIEIPQRRVTNYTYTLTTPNPEINIRIQTDSLLLTTDRSARNFARKLYGFGQNLRPKISGKYPHEISLNNGRLWKPATTNEHESYKALEKVLIELRKDLISEIIYFIPVDDEDKQSILDYAPNTKECSEIYRSFMQFFGINTSNDILVLCKTHNRTDLVSEDGTVRKFQPHTWMHRIYKKGNSVSCVTGYTQALFPESKTSTK